MPDKMNDTAPGVEEVANAAARNALTVTSGQVGKRIVRLADTGVLYLANAAGTGMDGLLATNGAGVVKPDALDEATIATHALVGNDDVVEGTGLGTATVQTNNDHDLS